MTVTPQVKSLNILIDWAEKVRANNPSYFDDVIFNDHELLITKAISLDILYDLGGDYKELQGTPLTTIYANCMHLLRQLFLELDVPTEGTFQLYADTLNTVYQRLVWGIVRSSMTAEETDELLKSDEDMDAINTALIAHANWTALDLKS